MVQTSWSCPTSRSPPALAAAQTGPETELHLLGIAFFFHIQKYFMAELVFYSLIGLSVDKRLSGLPSSPLPTLAPKSKSAAVVPFHDPGTSAVTVISRSGPAFPAKPSSTCRSCGSRVAVPVFPEAEAETSSCLLVQRHFHRLFRRRIILLTVHEN